MLDTRRTTSLMGKPSTTEPWPQSHSKNLSSPSPFLDSHSSVDPCTFSLILKHHRSMHSIILLQSTNYLKHHTRPPPLVLLLTWYLPKPLHHSLDHSPKP